ncbi:SHOCT domain-containing protein [Sporomusa acidovorans]|nr:SHOCT domain-containing protein [Sporomusa acidovorans]
MMLIFWGLILWGGFILVRKLIQTSQENRLTGTSRTAIEILKERYAKGEIGREDFEQMKQDLL